MLDLAKSLEEQRVGQRRETAHGPMAKTLTDLCRYKEIFREAKPNVLVETGTWTGASAHWYGYQMHRAIGHPVSVVTIDTHQTDPWHLAADALDGYSITGLDGSSTDADVIGAVRAHIGMLGWTTRVMVVLDSDHAAAHVERELELYAPLVSVGQYLVVEDTITRSCSPPGAGYDGSPADALDRWGVDYVGEDRARIPGRATFVVDMDLEDMLPTTQHPGGWLRRVW